MLGELAGNRRLGLDSAVQKKKWILLSLLGFPLEPLPLRTVRYACPASVYAAKSWQTSPVEARRSSDSCQTGELIKRLFFQFEN